MQMTRLYFWASIKVMYGQVAEFWSVQLQQSSISHFQLGSLQFHRSDLHFFPHLLAEWREPIEQRPEMEEAWVWITARSRAHANLENTYWTTTGARDDTALCHITIELKIMCYRKWCTWLVYLYWYSTWVILRFCPWWLLWVNLVRNFTKVFINANFFIQIWLF